MLKAKLLGATAVAEAALAIEDVFSTYLYTATGTTQRITNGIDLAGEGGLVWMKRRNSTGNHGLYDTLRGISGLGGGLATNNANATNGADIAAFYSDGFSAFNNTGQINGSGDLVSSWTFRQAPRFFDVVTYTGTGANRTIAHDLGVVPGCIIVKRRETTGDWQVYHRSLANTEYMVLNSTAAKATGATRWNSTTPTSSVFSLGTDATVNASGGTYVAYLFAHDPLGPSGDGSDGLIACGSFTTDGSGNATVDLGWEPQFSIFKATNDSSNWVMVDTMRGWLPDLANQKLLYPNLSNAETAGSNYIRLNSRGFAVTNNALGTNQSYTYIAIRRGPMREPTVGTEVFDAYFNSSSVTLGQSTGVTIVPDFVIARDITAATRDFNVADRLRGAGGINPDASFSKAALYTNTTGAEVSDKPFFDIINKHGNVTVGGEGAGVAGLWGLFLKRAPGFFDVVAYTGDGVAGRTVSHNLSVAPEMMIVKCRSQSTNWPVYHSGLNVDGDGRPETDYLILSQTQAAFDNVVFWNDTAPDSSAFTLGTNLQVNQASSTYIAYLFASLPGISKVGSYTGNGSSQTINCGFTTGARFILIKRTDGTGDWYVWDTKQGIVSGNDPRLKLNDPGSQVTTDDSVDPDSTGFIVNQVAATNVNVNAATYIYLAIA